MLSQIAPCAVPGARFPRKNAAEVGDGLPRDWMDREQGEGHEFLHEATQVKNIWVPTGE